MHVPKLKFPILTCCLDLLMKHSLFYFSRTAAAVSQDASLSKVLTERSTTRVPLWISETDIGGYDLFDLQFKIRQTCSWKCALPKIFLGIIVLILWNRSETNAEGKRLSLKKENSVKNLIQSGCSHVLKDFRFRGIFSEHVVRGFKHMM